jgi:transcription termination factor Rho
MLSIVLLIDERPEEVTDMQRSVRRGCIINLCEPTPRHVAGVEMVIKRMAQASGGT